MQNIPLLHILQLAKSLPPWSFLRCSDGRRRLGWFWPLCCWRRILGCPNVLMWSLWNALLEMVRFRWLYGELVWKEALMTWDIPISWIFAPRMDSRALASLILYMLCICAGIDNLKFYCMHLLYSLNFEVGAQWALECKAWCLLPLCDLLQFFYADVAWTIISFTCIITSHAQPNPDLISTQVILHCWPRCLERLYGQPRLLLCPDW